jgi:hypothetical protein
MLWIVGWYLFCALLITGLICVWRWLSQPRFRDSMGDITTEVGYEEDSMGNVHGQEFGAGVIPDTGEAHIGIGSAPRI